MSDRVPSRAVLGAVLRRQRGRTVIGCLLAMLHQICEALVPLAIGLTIDRAVATGDAGAMVIAVLGVLGLFTVLALAAAFGYRIIDIAAYTEAHRLRTDAIAGVLAEPRRAGERRTGELLSIATSDAVAAAAVVRVVGVLIAGVAGVVVSIVVLLRIDLVLGAALVVVVPLLLFGVDRLAPWLERRVHDQQQTSGLAAASAAELVAGLRPLRGFGGVAEAVRRYTGVSRDSLQAMRGAASAQAVVSGSGQLATGVIMVGTAIVAVAMAVQGRITLGELVTVVAMASFLADPVRTIAFCVGLAATARASAARLADLTAPVAGRSVVDRLDGPLVFAGVGHGPLRALDLRIDPRTLTGIACESPATASALLELITGATGPDDGTLSLAGRPVSELDEMELRHRVLAEPHATELLGGTLGEALRTSDGPPDDQLRRTVLTAAGADDAIESLRAGRDDTATDDLVLLDQAANLSGGQRQRLALARALAARRPVLVLHEPLTAVDAVTEDRIADSLAGVRRGLDPEAATVVITTSPMLLSRCDQVAWLPTGADARVANHEDLLADDAYATAVLR